jgi:hypothetical protein
VTSGDEYKGKNNKIVRVDSIHQRRQQKAMRVVRLGFFGRLKHAMVDHMIFVTHLCSDIPWTNRELLDRQKTVVARVLAVVGFLGCVGSIIENELIFREVNPSDPAIEVIKLVVLCTSALALAILYHYYWITHLFLQVRCWLPICNCKIPEFHATIQPLLRNSILRVEKKSPINHCFC